MVWTVTDASSTYSHLQLYVTVTDNQKPTISCVGNQTRNTDPGVCTYTAVGTEFNPTAFETTARDQPSAITITAPTLAGAIFPEGNHNSNMDSNGCFSTYSHLQLYVTVTDAQIPTISCVGNQSRNTDPGVCTYTAVGTEFNPTAFNDNCPGSTINNYQQQQHPCRSYLPEGNHNSDMDSN